MKLVRRDDGLYVASQGHLSPQQLELAKRVVGKHLDPANAQDQALARFLQRGGLELPAFGPDAAPGTEVSPSVATPSGR